MTRRFFRNENLLYAAAFILALVIRLAGLGRLPLSDSEATLALQALALSKGQETIISPHPAYLVLSMVWMFLFGASHWTARFWPAIAGSALVLCPALFKRQLGKIPSLILSFLLIFDPAMLAVSQQAGSLAIALLFVALFAGFFFARKPALAGIAGGMALLSGPELWPGLLGIGLSILVGRLFGFFVDMESDNPAQQSPLPLDFPWRTLLWFLLGTVFFAGTLFFAFPRGLSALAGGLASYFQGWTVPASDPAELLLIALVVYEFFVLFLGLWGAITGLFHKNSLDRFLLTWCLISIILAIFYPARQETSIAWAVLPLAALAARQLTRMFDIALEDWLPAVGQAILSGLILGFISLTALAMVNNPQYMNEREYWVRLAGAFVMLIASAGLIAWGWSKEVSLRGLTWGFCLILMIYGISSAWNVASLSSHSGLDFWNNKKTLPDETLLLTTIDQIDQWAPPVSGGYDLVVVGIQSPALQWSLRKYAKVEFSSQFPVGTSPGMIITRDQPNLPFSVAYRGEGFSLSQTVGWRLVHPDEWLRWMAFRVVPSEVILKEKMILWAKTDLFPGFEAGTAPNQVPAQPQENPK